MSDPVKNVEIEDVLSSIRKLVADDSRVAPAAPKQRPERLILTPAQRVSDEPTAAEDDEASAAPDPVLLQDPVEKPKPRIVEEKLENIPGDARLADFGEVEGSFPDIDDILSDAVDATEGEEEEFASQSARLELGRLIEEEVAAALRTDDPDGPAPYPLVEEVAEEPPERDEATEFAPSATDVPAEETETALGDVMQQDPYEEAPETPPSPMTLEDKVAALGRLVAGEPQDFEEERDTPDADELTAVSEPMTWPDAEPEPDPAQDMEPEGLQGTAPNVVHSDAAWSTPGSAPKAGDPFVEAKTEDLADPGPVSTEDDASQTIPMAASLDKSMQIDEDMLREIVSDIVRQELQGTLGERITRNVRKLVRREIHRMLIQQDLD